MPIITAQELVSYLRDDEATADDPTVGLLVDLANGLVGDELTLVTALPGWAAPTWVKILTLEIAERGWIKFEQEALDDWSGKRGAALTAMALSDDERLKLQGLDGRLVQSTGYSVRMTSPLDVP